MTPKVLATVARHVVGTTTVTPSHLAEIIRSTGLDETTLRAGLDELTQKGALTRHGDTYTTHTMALWSVVECARIS